jgi:3-phenylpropionate/cinnamic acid dioxygenase small subunit
MVSKFEDVDLFRGSDSDSTPGVSNSVPPVISRSAPAIVVSPVGNPPDAQRRVEQFLFHQSELLDNKAWRAYTDLFTEDGLYWMPVSREQQEWLDMPSIMIEDRSLMSVRMNRMLHPNAWSLAGLWETSHVVGNVVVETQQSAELIVRSRFHMFEQRRDVARQFAGTYRHTLVEANGAFRIKLQRVDLVNSQASFDYVIQAWI